MNVIIIGIWVGWIASALGGSITLINWFIINYKIHKISRSIDKIHQKATSTYFITESINYNKINI